jgi:hypothetical protein
VLTLHVRTRPITYKQRKSGRRPSRILIRHNFHPVYTGLRFLTFAITTDSKSSYSQGMFIPVSKIQIFPAYFLEFTLIIAVFI